MASANLYQQHPSRDPCFGLRRRQALARDFTTGKAQAGHDEDFNERVKASPRRQAGPRKAEQRTRNSKGNTPSRKADARISRLVNTERPYWYCDRAAPSERLQSSARKPRGLAGAVATCLYGAHRHDGHPPRRVRGSDRRRMGAFYRRLWRMPFTATRTSDAPPATDGSAPKGLTGC